MVKNLHTKQETQVRSLSREDLLEEEMVNHSSILPGESQGQSLVEEDRGVHVVTKS